MLKAYGLVNNNIKIIASFLLFFVFVFMGVGIETAMCFIPICILYFFIFIKGIVFKV